MPAKPSCLLLALCLAIASSVFAADAPEIHSAVDVFPQPLRTPPPEYPRKLQIKGITGMVVLELIVDDTGKVDSAAVVKSTEDDFNAPSLEAVKNWRFRPAQKDGHAVWVRLKLPLKFTPQT
ncbi:energy transducer TonB [Actomonas aquatica]|uniref:Energy transducer TonB n=1 Tax=Actomonas aquatica TaxID=2866162 RepID=A0ABZ1C4B1_9BACT|nr:energy transducer TonB [Opitutus sp. WL0086]WRQ86197.1 energy transducer TonB [Opitutus sp. WL0086]